MDVEIMDKTLKERFREAGKLYESLDDDVKNEILDEIAQEVEFVIEDEDNSTTTIDDIDFEDMNISITEEESGGSAIYNDDAETIIEIIKSHANSCGTK